MSRQRLFSFVLLTMAVSASIASAQGITLQEPTFSRFSVGTTVLVPDQGSTFTGGIMRSSQGSGEYGVPGLAFPPFRSRSIGQSFSSGGVSTRVFIHDFDAMDQALLGTPSPVAGWRPGELPLAGRVLPFRPGDPAGIVQQQPAQKTPPAEAAAGPELKLADEQARRAALEQTRADEAQAFFDKARQAEADGKPKVARIYYQMVVHRARGPLHDQAVARVEALGGGTARLAQDR